MESFISLDIESLPEGGYIATSADVPGLVAQGRTLEETLEIARDVARKIAESCLANGDPLPEALKRAVEQKPITLSIPVALP